MTRCPDCRSLCVIETYVRVDPSTGRRTRVVMRRCVRGNPGISGWKNTGRTRPAPTGAATQRALMVPCQPVIVSEEELTDEE